MPRENYEELKENRIARLEARAEKTATAAESSLAAGRKALSVIPFGQPLLCDHHSYKRDLNYRRRAVNKIDKGIELASKAENLQQRAASAESNTAISSDDPEAVRLLKEQLETREASQRRMKAVNAAWRKAQKNPAVIAETPGVHPHKTGLSPADRELVRLFKPEYSWQKGPFESYEMSNNNANIKRIRGRIAELEREEAAPEFDPITGDGWEITEDRDDNRLWITMDSKPSKDITRHLRASGWKWSRQRVAWIRMLNSNGRFAAKVAGEYLAENIGK